MAGRTNLGYSRPLGRVNLSQELAEALAEYTAATGLSRAPVVRTALAEHMANYGAGPPTPTPKPTPARR